MYSEYDTRMPLARFFQILGIPLWHASQLVIPASLQEAAGRQIGCDKVIYQHRYQSPVGVPGRNDIGRAIYEAERMIERALHFDLLKCWNREQLPVGLHAGRHGHPLKLDRSYYIEPAVRVSTLVEEAASIDEEDLDEDGYAETAQVVVTLDADTLAAYGSLEEFRVYYPEKAGDPRWEIRPTTVTIVGSELTISFSVSQLVDPKMYERMVPGPLDPEVPGNFIDSVDVYRVYSDTAVSNAVGLVCRNCDGTFTALSTSHASVWAEDKVGAVVRVLTPYSSMSFPSSSGFCGCWSPIETLSYAAGWPKSTYTQMDPHFEAAVVALAMANLGGICACESLLSYRDYGRDLSIVVRSTSTGGDGEHTQWARLPPDQVMKNPWGTSLGEVTAWGIIVDDIVGETMNEYRETVPTPIVGYASRGRGPLW